MRAIFFALAAIVCLSIFGCGPKPIDWSDPEETASRIVVSHDDFKKLTWYQGPWYDDQHGRIRLRSLVDGGGKTIQHQVYIDTYFWPEECFDSEGRPWRFVRVVPRRREQDLYVTVGKEYLGSKQRDGMQLRLYGGRLDEEIFTLPGGYVTGFLRIIAPIDLKETLATAEETASVTVVVEEPNEPVATVTLLDREETVEVVLDPRALRQGAEYRAQEGVSLMLDFDPGDPLNAITRFETINPGQIFVVERMILKGSISWYFIETKSDRAEEVLSGWVNNISVENKIEAVK